MTSQNQTQQKLFDEAEKALAVLPVFRGIIRKKGCEGCFLGVQPDLGGPVIYRGNAKSKLVILGEAPGKDEDKIGEPFVGPAGQLLDKIWAAVGWDTNEDWYLTNVTKCRPIAPAGSFKQNVQPPAYCRAACRPILNFELKQIQPKIIVLLGKIAVQSMLPQFYREPMWKLVGTEHVAEYRYFIMYHPAAILHASGQPEKYTELRTKTWEHIQTLRELVGK